MTTDNFVVYIVDDDPSVRDAIGLLLGLHGYKTAFFADGASFLQAWSAQMQGCLLLDIRMPGIDGLSLQRQLRDQGSALPVVIITGHGDVDASREAFKAYAIDFLEKPLQEAQLIQAIDEAFAKNAQSEQHRQAVAAYADDYATLTAREREVMEHIASGRHNREIAALLNISVRTVEVHKARIMDKLGTRNSVDLVRRHLQNELAKGRDPAPPGRR